MPSSTSRMCFTFSCVLHRLTCVRSPVIFEDYIGLERRLALILGGVNATVYALSAFFSYPMIERLGRRKMFLFGTAGQAGAMVSLRKHLLSIVV